MVNRFIHLILVSIIIILASCQPRNENGEQIQELTIVNLSEHVFEKPVSISYFNEEYHLFYEADTNQVVLDNILWKHLVSDDLMNWEERPLAVSADSSGIVLSGSLIIDENNSSGLGTINNPPIISFYSNEAGIIKLAFSLDNGNSWEEHQSFQLKGFIKTGLQYPKVNWNGILNEWLMTVSTGYSIQFYYSSDCIKWQYLCEFDGVHSAEKEWGDSDFFPLKDQDVDIEKWVLMVNIMEDTGVKSGSQYFVGDFDGNEFSTTQTQELSIDYGSSSLERMIFNDLEENRKLIFGVGDDKLLHNSTTESSSNIIFLPRELELVFDNNEYLLISKPASELSSFYEEVESISTLKVNDEVIKFRNFNFPQAPFVIHLLVNNSNRYALWGAHDYGLRFNTQTGKSFSIGYNVENSFYYIDRSNLFEEESYLKSELQAGVKYSSFEDTTDWDILVNHESVELFACGNKVAVSSILPADELVTSLEIYASLGSLEILEVVLEKIDL